MQGRCVAIHLNLSSPRQDESHLLCCPGTCNISWYGWLANFIFLLQTQANQICMSLTLLVLPSPELGKQLLQKKQRMSNCMTHPLKRESKSLCVNNCIINKSSSFSKLLTFWVKPFPSVIPVFSEFTWEEKWSSLFRDRGDSAHTFVSQLGKLVATLCLCIIYTTLHVHMHVCICIKKVNFVYVTNVNALNLSL